MMGRAIGCGHRSGLGRLRRDSAGGAGIEFALSAMALFAFLFALIETGRVAFTQHALERALRDAGRQAIVRSDDSGNTINTADIEALVRASAFIADDPSLTVTTTYPAGNVVGETLQISATYTVQLVVPFLPFSDIELSADYNGTILY